MQHMNVLLTIVLLVIALRLAGFPGNTSHFCSKSGLLPLLLQQSNVPTKETAEVCFARGVWRVQSGAIRTRVHFRLILGYRGALGAPTCFHPVDDDVAIVMSVGGLLTASLSNLFLILHAVATLFFQMLNSCFRKCIRL